ncbi:hypothetical protein ACVOZ6_003501 [Escherichia coli]
MSTMNAHHNMHTMCVYLSKGPSCNQTNGLPDGGRTFNWKASVQPLRAARMHAHKRKDVAPLA